MWRKTSFSPPNISPPSFLEEKHDMLPVKSPGLACGHTWDTETQNPTAKASSEVPSSRFAVRELAGRMPKVHRHSSIPVHKCFTCHPANTKFTATLALRELSEFLVHQHPRSGAKKFVSATDGATRRLTSNAEHDPWLSPSAVCCGAFSHLLCVAQCYTDTAQAVQITVLLLSGYHHCKHDRRVVINKVVPPRIRPPRPLVTQIPIN